MRITYYVTADHVSPEFTFNNTEVIVSKSGNGFFAQHPKLGCGKAQDSAPRAILSLFEDHACRNIRARTEPTFLVKVSAEDLRFLRSFCVLRVVKMAADLIASAKEFEGFEQYQADTCCDELDEMSTIIERLRTTVVEASR